MKFSDLLNTKAMSQLHTFMRAQQIHLLVLFQAKKKLLYMDSAEQLF